MESCPGRLRESGNDVVANPDSLRRRNKTTAYHRPARHGTASTINNVMDEIMNTAVIESDQRTTVLKVGYGMLGFIYAVAAYQVPALVVALVIASTGIANLIQASILIQFAVGISLSVIAFSIVSNRSLKFGMLVCYVLIVGTLFILGGYTILTSIASL